MMDDFLDKSEIVGHKIRPTLEGENAIDKLEGKAKILIMILFVHSGVGGVCGLQVG